MAETLRALVVDKPEGSFSAGIRTLNVSNLPAGDVLVRVAFSSLNYKDGMAVANTGPIIRSFPFVPGIDLAGTVVESDSDLFRSGDKVLATGYGIGERHWGGYAELARLPDKWLLPLPETLSLEQAMAVGTAGFTAMQCVQSLESHGMRPDGRDVVVTGAAGGVGSVAVAILSSLGYQVTASSGRSDAAEYLRDLGATKVIDRAVLASPSTRPLEAEAWGGAVDSVGGTTLASILRQLRYGASVAACGLAGGTDLSTSVYPFILRGVSLLGIDSVQCPQGERRAIWQRIARDLPLDKLAAMTQVVGLAEVLGLAGEIVAGRVRGRVVVDVNR